MLTDYLYCYCIPRWDLDRQLQQTSRYLPGYRLSILSSRTVCWYVPELPSRTVSTPKRPSPPFPRTWIKHASPQSHWSLRVAILPHQAIPTRNCVVHVQVVVLLVGTPLSTRQLYRRFATPTPLTSFFSTTKSQKGSVNAAFSLRSKGSWVQHYYHYYCSLILQHPTSFHQLLTRGK